VWKFCNGKRTVEQLAQQVARETKTEANEDLVWLALRQLSRANLLEQPSPALPLTAQLTRREFLQRAAFAAVVIPVVKTISAPAAQQVASCLPNGSPCTADFQCCTGACDTEVEFECFCFVAGTLVLYGDGTRRPIERVRPGDLVLSRDQAGGAVAPQAVERTYVHQDRATFTLDYGTSALGTTATHPFYTDNGWVKAIDLRPGMDCYLDSGARITLQRVEHPQAHPQTVYNLQVTGFHTYFVGSEGVWVHNRTTQRDIPTS
jgi:hypothetical protein